METSNESIKEIPVEEKPVETSEDTATPEGLKAFLGEEPPKEEKPKEPVVEPEKPEVEEAEIPLEEITAEVVKKTKEEVKADILKAIGMTEEEKKAVEELGYKTPWEKRGEDAPKTWPEVIEAAAEYQAFKKEQQEEELSEKQKQEMVAVKERETTINAEWDSQLDYLRSEGLIPQIDEKIQKKLKEGKTLTVQERSDPGLQAQAGIFEAMYNVAQERELMSQSPVVDVVHVFNRYYKKPTKPAGASAPVSGGNIPISNKEEELPYEKLHGASFEELVKSP